MTNDKGILIQNIYYMLTYAFQVLCQNNYESIKGEKFDDIYNLFAEILSRGIAYQLKQGLHKEYVSKMESLSTLRGKLDINGTIRQQLQRRNSLECEYDEFSENCIFNKILKTTCGFLINCQEVDKVRKRKLHKLMLYFNNVDEININTVRWTALRFDRNSRTYQMLIYLCRFIHNQILLTTEKGKYKMMHFSDSNMNRLYEKFILEFYRKHYPTYKAQAIEVDWNICKSLSDTDILPTMKTDVTLFLPGNRRLIIDAKYYGNTMQKYFDKYTIHSANLYQIQSYVLNLDCEHMGNVDGVLLYAKTQEDIYPKGKVTLKDGNTIYFKTLDLSQKFDCIEKQLKKLVEDIATNNF